MSEILDMVRLSYSGDAFDTVQGWRFALCDYLTSEMGEHVPDFRQSPMGPDEDAYEYEYLIEMQASAEECQRVLKILDRAREILRVEGLDY